MVGWDPIGDWWRSSPKDGTDYQFRQFVKNIPFLGSFFEADDNQRQMQQYLDDHGLQWSDVKYNKSLGAQPGQAAASAGSAILNLYRPFK